MQWHFRPIPIPYHWIASNLSFDDLYFTLLFLIYQPVSANWPSDLENLRCNSMFTFLLCIEYRCIIKQILSSFKIFFMNPSLKYLYKKEIISYYLASYKFDEGLIKLRWSWFFSPSEFNYSDSETKHGIQALPSLCVMSPSSST